MLSGLPSCPLPLKQTITQWRDGTYKWVRDVVVSNHVYIMLLVGPISAPKCLSYQELLRSCSELLFGCSKLKTKDFIPILRIYGFEGEAGREGEVFTRIY